MEPTQTEPTDVNRDAAYGAGFAALSEADKETVRRGAAQLVDKAAYACDRIALEHPDYAEIIAVIKADLLRLPSAGHAACAIRALLDIAQGTYDDFDDFDAAVKPDAARENGAAESVGGTMFPGSLFPLGRLKVTPGAAFAIRQAFGNESSMETLNLIEQHSTGQWDELDDEDKATNRRAIEEGGPVHTVYHLPANNPQSLGEKVYVYTEPDRSATTILLPSEY